MFYGIDKDTITNSQQLHGLNLLHKQSTLYDTSVQGYLWLSFGRQDDFKVAFTFLLLTYLFVTLSLSYYSLFSSRVSILQWAFRWKSIININNMTYFSTWKSICTCHPLVICYECVLFVARVEIEREICCFHSTNLIKTDLCVQTLCKLI